ncbi:MAG: ABC transporter transmembrane domain-containing protein, partial [Ferruginibacter sp.]
MSESAKVKKVFDFSLLRRVFYFASPYKSKFYWSIFLAIFLAIISPVRPWLIQVTINDGLLPGAHVGFLRGAAQVIIGITIIQLALLLIETLCRFVFTFFTASLGQSVVKDMRVATYKKVIDLNLSQYDKTPIGTLTTRTINDIESINDIFSE